MSTNYKPFNLERALAGDPVVTRNGMKVLNIAYLPDAPDNSKIVCVIDSGHGYTNCITFYQSGSLWLTDKEHNMDLFMAPIEKEYWVASGKGINSYDKNILCTRLCNTEDEIRRLVLGTGLLPETIQFHKITRLE